ncbi:MAG: phytanoyl-CoA dioxygenase family protein [Verrucomicrobiota bacterium]|nr:phytanoyl-CoA dioxygenase family protein [Verrucomicrobiota bacterium]
MKIEKEIIEIHTIYSSAYQKLPFKMKLQVTAKMCIIFPLFLIYKLLVLIKVVRRPQILDDIDGDLTDFALKDSPGKYHLSKDEVKSFNENGYIKPFKVIEPKLAAKIYENLPKQIMDGKIVYGVFPDVENEERKIKMNRIGLRDDLVSRGFNRHFNIKEYVDILTKPEIVQRLASIFGSDVYLWRSQFFCTEANSTGTALHQATDFSFAMNKTVLKKKENCNLPMSLVNLTAWVALQDTSIKNAALVFCRASHKNNRFEQWFKKPFFVLTQSSLKEAFFVILIKLMGNVRGSHFHIADCFTGILTKIDPKIKEILDKIETVNMKAGEAIIFTSRTIHGSHPNSTRNDRMAIAGRYTTNGVAVYPDGGDYIMTNHFRPEKPLLLDKYKKIFKLGGCELDHKVTFSEVDATER